LRRLITLAALLVVASCGRGSSIPTLDVLSSSAAAFEANKTFRWEASASYGDIKERIDPSTRLPDRPLNLLLRARGVNDLVNDRASGSIVIEVPAAARRALGLEPVECRVIVIEKDAYLSIPPSMRARYSGRSWLNEKLVQSGQRLNVSDPEAFLDVLFDAAASIREVGTESVRNVMTTKYRVRLDARKLRQRFSKDPSVGFLSAGSIDLWVDADHLPRRLRVTGDDEDYAGISFVSDFFDYGEPADIEAPGKSEVASPPQGTGSALNVCLGEASLPL
jgi:hypothetical protein